MKWWEIVCLVISLFLAWYFCWPVKDDPEMEEIKRSDGILPKEKPSAPRPDYARIAELERTELGIVDGLPSSQDPQPLRERNDP